jgi:hypothetical protein
MHPAETLLILRFKKILPREIINLNSFIEIQGSKSGDISGETLICKDQRTINFKPARTFISGERVSVSLSPIISVSDGPFVDSTFYFDISSDAEFFDMIEKPIYEQNLERFDKSVSLKKNLFDDPHVKNGVSIPSDFPQFEVTTNKTQNTDLIFLNSIYYAFIIDNNGNPLWYQHNYGNPLNLKVQNDILTLNIYDWNESIAFDSTYTIVKYFVPPQDYNHNPHELKLLPNGNYMIIVDERQTMDLSHIGGQVEATVIGNHIAEMDEDGNLVFFWRSWDHYNIADAIHEDLTRNTVNPFHINSIDVDQAGHILVSSRNQSEITKINRQTGDVIWRLGGENDYFTWTNDSIKNSYQHDVRVLDNGNITLFDNGRFRSPEFSRALELSIDTTAWEVTKVWEFRDDPDVYAQWMGSVQRLPNGATGILWEKNDMPRYTEVLPDNSKEFELDFNHWDWVYRVQRFPWKGKAAVPYLIVEPYDDRITLLFNKFGDPDVMEYIIYGGLDPAPTSVLATTSAPFVHLTELLNHRFYYFRVTAVNSSGYESSYSNEEWAYTKLVYPGSNLVVNGNFARDLYYWDETVDEDYAYADIYVTENEELRIEIYDPGSQPGHIQVKSDGFDLELWKEYIFEFDGYARSTRYLDAEVIQDGRNISNRGSTLLRTFKDHFEQSFVVEEESELKAKVVFSAGGNSHDIFIDNVSVKEVVTSIDSEEHVPYIFSLKQNYPNPFNPKTLINYQLPKTSNVEISIYNLLGQKVAILIDEKQNPGNHQVKWDASGFASGIYLYKIEAGEFQDVKKMILLR